MNYKKTLTILAIALFLATLSFFGSGYYYEKQLENYLERQNVYLAALQEIKEERVYYVINKGTGNISAYQILEVTDEGTVFSLLEKLSKKQGFEIKTTQYDFGIFVESIEGFQNGQEGKYWQYWVNDKLGEVAADKKKIKRGDKVEWRFEVPPEFF